MPTAQRPSDVLDPVPSPTRPSPPHSWGLTPTVRVRGLVRGNTMLNFHTYGGSTYTSVVDFTATGELLIVQHTLSR